ncbi:MAG TPA: ComF family protein [Thermoanaerobaculia bacterium]|nr:ComF family protein [Thermoanaerobaculia bacterium]
MTFRHALTLVGREAARIVLPSWCVVCDRELPWRDRVASCCVACWNDLPRLDAAQCRSCALPLPVEDDELCCVECQVDPLPLDWCAAWGVYRGGLERLIHALKFERHDFLAGPLARPLLEAAGRYGPLKFDRLVPVPMHRSKLRQRGYNQAELLASSLGKATSVRVDGRLLSKRIERGTQSRLTRSERAANVRGVFEARPCEGLALLLVDDVCTTGETLRECARVLRGAGAARVCAVTLAKTV